jgi:hypothetical protein
MLSVTVRPIMLNVIMLNVVMLSVFMLYVVMLNVAAPRKTLRRKRRHDFCANGRNFDFTGGQHCNDFTAVTYDCNKISQHFLWHE